MGRAALTSGYMINLHSFSVRVHVIIGYFRLAEILVCNTVQDSLGGLLPILTFPPQSIAAVFNSLISLVLLPLEDSHITKISEAVSHISLYNDTRVPFGVITTRSRSVRVSSTVHFPCFQM